MSGGDMDVFINGKRYKKIEQLSQAKLEHLLQLAQIEVDNYKNHIRNYPEARMKSHGIPALKMLEGRRDVIQQELKNK
jgi:hypothetical protein